MGVGDNLPGGDMKLISFDPSSSLCGYAIIETIGRKVLEAGLLKPHRKSDPANERIRAMVRDAAELIAEQDPDAIVIEDTSGKVARRHGTGGGAGLAVYGKAVGWLAATCERIRPGKVTLILENEWTGGISKARRMLHVRAAAPLIDLSTDTGGDMADAIGIGLYFVRKSAL